MDQERNLGVTEARFALTLLTCLLVAIGYIALLRLGGAKEPMVEPGTDDVSPPKVVEHDNELLPRVLPIEKPENRPIEHTARPTDSERR